MEKEKRKITPNGFQMMANTYLQDTYLHEKILSRISLDTDEDGKIKEYVIEGIKTSLRVGVRMTPDDIVKSKCKAMLVFLEDY